MTVAKKLPCGHIFHLVCLRSWLQRQQTCPTCRIDVLQNNRPGAPGNSQKTSIIKRFHTFSKSRLNFETLLPCRDLDKLYHRSNKFFSQVLLELIPQLVLHHHLASLLPRLLYSNGTSLRRQQPQGPPLLNPVPPSLYLHNYSMVRIMVLLHNSHFKVRSGTEKL